MRSLSSRIILGLLVGPLVTLAVILGNELVYVSFLSSHDFINGLLNTWPNFPWGLVTAIFTPDSQVFLCYTGGFSPSSCFQYFTGWFELTVSLLLSYLALFFVVNLRCGIHDLSLRSSYYGLMIIAISAVSNLIGLYMSPGSVGPSTAAFAGLGLVYGFGIVNSIVFIRGERDLAHGRDRVALAFSLAMAVVLTALYVISPADFFNVNSAQRIDSEAHMVCFAGGTLVSLPFLFGTQA
jgi:hypothetical protein